MVNEEPIRCLIADDDLYVADFLKEAISDPDVVASIVHDGEQALDALAQGTAFDILITDLNMPKMSGEELLKQVRKISPKTLIIVLTGYGSINSAVSLIQQGAFDYLTKPVELQDFFNAMEKAVDHVKSIRKKKLKGDISKVWHISQLIDKTLSPNHLLEGIIENAIKVTHGTAGVIFLKLEQHRWRECAQKNLDSDKIAQILAKIQNNVDSWQETCQEEINKNTLRILPLSHNEQIIFCPFTEEKNVVGILAILLDENNVIPHLAGLLAIFCSQVYTIVTMAIRIHQLLHTNEEMIKTHVELERLHEELKQSAKLACIGELSASIAHDINTPLTCIIGFVKLAIRLMEKPNFEQEDKKKVGDYLDKIGSESTRCQQIIRDLLLFSRKESKTFEPIHIQDVILKTMEILKEQFSEKKIHFSMDIHDSFPKIIGNSNQLQQVFMNLFVNAKNAMAEGGSLYVKAEAANNSQMVKIFVMDTGKGIPQENLNKIFEPFFTTNPSGKGTGLGLSISKKIIKEHGGDIQVDSQVNKGTTFILSLAKEEKK
ncbi:MAG: response regulator [Candidatus Brocadiae bacterium]|nr:response regulator [Candidatus Brocadiia bacterium]